MTNYLDIYLLSVCSFEVGLIPAWRHTGGLQLLWGSDLKQRSALALCHRTKFELWADLGVILGHLGFQVEVLGIPEP